MKGIVETIHKSSAKILIFHFNVIPSFVTLLEQKQVILRRIKNHPKDDLFLSCCEDACATWKLFIK